MAKLRDYQLEAVNTIWSRMFTKDHILVQAPTGIGKTITFVELCRRSIEKKPDVRILVTMNKVRLVEQTAKQFGDVAGVYCGSLKQRDKSKPVTVASIQSVCKEDLGHINILIIDEAHLFSMDGQYKQLMERLKATNPNMKVIGFTATPYTSTGYIYGKNRFFDKVDFSVSLPWAIKQGYLVNPVMKKAPHEFVTDNVSIVAGDYDQGELAKLTEDDSKISAQVADALPRLEGRKCVVWACVTIKHAEMVHNRLVGAAIVHSKQEKFEQDWNLEEFESGRLRHLVFVSMVHTGYDHPPIDAVVLMRPTKSPVLYVQTVGRGLRTYPGKKDLLVLDYGRVVANCGPLDSPRIPEKRERKGFVPSLDEVNLKACPRCLTYMHSALSVCKDCGYEYPAKDPVKSLYEKAQDGTLMRSTEPMWSSVSSVTLSKYESKNGNICLKITYFPKNLISETSLSEFFVENNQWAWQRAHKRLIQLGIPPVGCIDDVLKHKPTRIPTAIKYIFENKYRKVVDLCFHEGNGETNRIKSLASSEFAE